jgi:aminoglycoside/choline kinase family phosphotransferase
MRTGLDLLPSIVRVPEVDREVGLLLLANLGPPGLASDK